MSRSLIIALFSSLCLTTSVLAQDDPYKTLSSYVIKTAQFNQLCPQEKVYVHFDNTAYFQGDVIWFSAYVVNASTGAPAPSKVLYVDLLSPTGTLLRQVKLKVVDGRCHGSIPLVDSAVEDAVALRGALSYPSGFYEVRAYTLNMLNFGSYGIFSRVLPVYQMPEEEGNWEQTVLNTSIAPWNVSDRPKSDDTKEVNVSFYPEGGTLVQGIPCRVAFKAVDEHGQGLPVIGVIKDEEGVGEDLALLSTLWDGMGAFTFTPTKKHHTARFTYEGKNYTFTLPEAATEGYALQVDNLSGQQLKGVLTAVGDKKKPVEEVIGLSLLCECKPCAFDTIHAIVDDNIASYAFSVPTTTLPTGVHQLTLFSVGGDVLAQRLVFINNGIHAATVTASMDKSTYAPFAPMNMHLVATNTDGSPLQTSLSVSVRDAHDYGTDASTDFLTDKLLSSELKGFIHHPEAYFTDNKTRALDLLMMTQGWTRYNWRQMAQVEPFTINHYVEDGLVLDGTLLTRMKGNPYPEASVTMKIYSPDRQNVQQTTVVTDENGRFGFSVEEFEGRWDMFLSARKDDKPLDARMRLDRSARPDLRAYEPSELYLPEHKVIDDDFLAKTPVRQQIQSDPDSVFHLDEVEIEGRRKYIDYMTFKAFDAEEDTEYQLDCGNFTEKVSDYLMEKGYDLDVSRYDGVVPDSIRIREDFISWTLNQCLLNSHRVLWYLHDEHRNLALSAFTPGFDMDMEDIKSIIVYDSPTIFESMPVVRETLTIEQITALRSRGKLDDGTPVPPGLYVIDINMYPSTERRARAKGTRQTTFRGFDEPAEFYAPTYPDGPIVGDKDYRRTLYWNPDLRTDANGQADVLLYNNGYSRSFTVSAQGITESGIPVVTNK